MVARFVTIMSARAGLLALVVAAAGTLAAAGSASPALAASSAITVCPSGCDYASIQAAIDAAPSGATITVAPGTYTGGLTTDNKNLTLLGAGATQTTISGGTHVIEISSGTVRISGVTITGANGGGVGGGILNNGGTVTLTDSTVTGNIASFTGHLDGAGIFNRGTMTLNDSTVSGNTLSFPGSVGFGGGIFNVGTLTLTDSTVTGNTAGFFGGGINNSAGGPVMLKNSTVSCNNPDQIVGPYTQQDSTVGGSCA